MIHYVYKIINNKPTDKQIYYIGVRTTKELCINNDSYMGSSKYLTAAIKEQGSNQFTKEILSEHHSREEAVKEEIRLHSLFDVGVNPKFYNRSKQTSTKFDTTGIKVLHSIERNNKISKTLKGIKHSNLRKENNSLAQKKLYDNGYINPNTPTVRIFNSFDELMFLSSKISFTKFCQINNLPFRQLISSYQNNGAPIYSISETSKKRAISNGFGKYIGWYATKL